MKRLNKLWIALLLLSFGLSSNTLAQSDLQISKVFEQFGEQKGVVMVELTDELLEGYDFTLFKSITIKDNASAADFIRKCLQKDEIGAKKVKQVLVNGIATSIYLQLRPKAEIYRLILFNESSKPEPKITLIYIESKNNSEDVLKLILKKK
jgi:hypothetical protein